MYRRPKRLIGIQEDISNYVDGFDIFDSTLIKYITNQSVDREVFTITKNEYRPDLIAKEYYGSVSYMGILMIQTGLSLDNYTRGTQLYLLPKETIDIIINSMTYE